MLKNIPKLIGPELLHALRAMGHGDEIVISDANFPASSQGPVVIRMDGHSATDVLEAVLSLMPLDEFVEESAFTMQVVGDPEKQEPIVAEFGEIVARHEPDAKMGTIERFDFYDRATEAFVIVQTGEERLYGNIILKKGIIRPGGPSL